MVVDAELEKVIQTCLKKCTSTGHILYLALLGEEASDRNINHYYLARLIVCLRTGYKK